MSLIAHTAAFLLLETSPSGLWRRSAEQASVWLIVSELDTTTLRTHKERPSYPSNLQYVWEQGTPVLFGAEVIRQHEDFQGISRVCAMQ